MLEEVIFSWWEVRWIWQMRQNFVAQLVKPLKRWLCDVWPGVTMEKNWHLSVDQCRLQVLQFRVPLSDFLSILPRCNGFSGIQKAVVDQTGSRPPNSDQTWCKFGLGKCFAASPQSHHWAGHHQLSYKIHFLSQVTIQSRNGSLLLRKIREDNASKWQVFLFVVSSWDNHLSSFFTFQHLLQKPKDCRKVDIQFFGNFSCNCKRISFDNCSNWLLSTSNVRPLHSSSSRFSSPPAKLLFLKNLFIIYLFLALLGLCCCSGFSLVVVSGD